MKPPLRILSLALGALLALRAAAAQDASSDRPIYIGILGGGEVATGAYASSTAHSVAGLFGLELLYLVPESHLSVRLDAAYHQFADSGHDNCVLTPLPTDNAPCDPNPVTGMLTLSGNIAVRLFSRDAIASPYVLGGLALRGVASGPNAASSPTSGVQYGAGIEAQPGRRAIFFLEWRHLEMGTGGYSAVLLGLRF